MAESFLEEQLKRMREMSERMSRASDHAAELSNELERDRESRQRGPLSRRAGSALLSAPERRTEGRSRRLSCGPRPATRDPRSIPPSSLIVRPRRAAGCGAYPPFSPAACSRSRVPASYPRPILPTIHQPRVPSGRAARRDRPLGGARGPARPRQPGALVRHHRPGALQPLADQPPAPVIDRLAVITWNVHVGSGDVADVVRRLRTGEYTGGPPVEHFVLLLQEAYRRDTAVPARSRAASPHPTASRLESGAARTSRASPRIWASLFLRSRDAQRDRLGRFRRSRQCHPLDARSARSRGRRAADGKPAPHGGGRGRAGADRRRIALGAQGRERASRHRAGADPRRSRSRPGSARPTRSSTRFALRRRSPRCSQATSTPGGVRPNRR